MTKELLLKLIFTWRGSLADLRQHIKDMDYDK